MEKLGKTLEKMKNFSGEEVEEKGVQEPDEDVLVREDGDTEPLEDQNPGLFVKNYGRHFYKQMEGMAVRSHLNRIDELQRRRSNR